MTTLGRKSDKVTVVNADLMGTCRNREFVEKYPERSFNVGIAEQNLISFAAGLAHEGFISYVFSMAPFISMRACEQCRTDVAYAKANVRFMATYSGVSGGISGATHWALEDCGIMCSMPGVVVLEPSDPTQIMRMLDFSLDFQGPIYLRSSVEPMEAIYNDEYKFELGKATKVVNGNDGAFICAGVTVNFAVEAAKRIKETLNKEICVVDMHTIKPIDREAIIEATKTGRVVVAQDHNIIGGLGSMVATVIAEEGCSTKFKILGVPDCYVAMAHAPYLYKEFGYDSSGLEDAMKKMLVDTI